MKIEDVDVSEYDEADRSYHIKLAEMYRYMVHIKPYVLAEMMEGSAEKKAKVVTIYANLCMLFGEFKAMTATQMPNLAYKRKFFIDTTGKFNKLLVEYSKLVSADKLVLTEAEKKIVI